jgi:hypothetical protein
LLGLTGCKVGWLIDRTAPDAVRDSKSYYEELRQRQVDQVLASFDPSADKESLRPDLSKVMAVVPVQVPIGVETLGGTVECKGSGVCTKVITLEYQYPDRWILFQATVSNGSGHYAITDLDVKNESMPAESMGQFTLRGKGWLNYAILLMALLSTGLAIYALVLCIRTPIKKRKWLWIIVTILGIGEFGIEWSSGEFWHKIFYITLPSGFGFETDGPFMYVSIPAGAILFLLLRNRLRKTTDQAPAISTPALATAADLDPDAASPPSDPLP